MLAKKCLFVGMITLLCLYPVLADPPATHPATGEELVIDCLRGTPDAIDGDLSDWNLAAMTPAVLDVAEQLNSGQASWDNPEDLSGEFYLLWDNENVYMAVIVKDDVISNNKSGADIWNADCVEVFFGTTNAVAPHDEHYQYGFNADALKWNWCNMHSAGQSDPFYLEVAATKTPDGYICEASIPHAEISALDWSVGSIIGFHPVIDDTDAADREIQMTWTSREAHDQSQGFGYLVLSDERALAKELAKNAIPESDAVDVSIDTILSWDAGEYAAKHDVYFGTTMADVNDASAGNPMGVLLSQGQTDASLDAGRLEYGQTYYWRVDEVNSAADNTVVKGDLWSFTAEPMGVAIENVTATASGGNVNMGPENAVNGSGLDELDQHSMDPTDMWLTQTDGSWIQFDFDKPYILHELLVWNSNQAIEAFIGFGVKEATIETSVDGETWTALDGVTTLAKATGLPNYAANSAVALGGVMAQQVKLSVVSAHGFTGQAGLAEVRFTAIPVSAREPQPADGGISAGVEVELQWRSGRGAASHQVSFGNAADALAPLETTADTVALTDVLDYDTTYYWSVTEVNDAADPSSHVGNIWSFTTPACGIVDDFEAYTKDEGQEIFMTWFDGFGGDASLGGSTTGHFDSPFIETAIVNGGKKSMPFYYDNDGGFSDIDGNMSAPNFSEVVREFDSAQDWTASGIASLSIAFQGSADNTGQLYCKIGDSKILYDGPATDIGQAAWTVWNVDLASVGGNLASVRQVAIGIEGGGSGVVYIDDLCLYPGQ